MNNAIKAVFIAGMIGAAAPVAADSVSDDFNDGDTLTATMLDNIKSAINDNHARVAVLEGMGTGIDIAIDCDADSAALRNTRLVPGNTYVLTGMCDGPVFIGEPAGRYRIQGDASGFKDDGIVSPPGLTERHVLGLHGPVVADLENLTISADNYTSQSDGVYTAGIFLKGNASASLADVDVTGGDAGIFSDNSYVAIGAGVNVTGFGQSGILAGRGGSVHIGQPVTVTGAINLPGEYSEALAAFRNGAIQVNNGGTFTAGTDDGSNPDFEGYSLGAYDNGTIRIQDSGSVNLTGIIGAFRSSVIRVRTGTGAGIVWSGDQSHVRLENFNHTGGRIEIFRGAGFRADNSTLGSDNINVGQMSNIRLNGSTVGNASGTGSIDLYGYGYLSLRNGTNLNGRDVNCIDAQSFSPSDAVNIGTVSC